MEVFQTPTDSTRMANCRTFHLAASPISSAPWLPWARANAAVPDVCWSDASVRFPSFIE